MCIFFVHIFFMIHDCLALIYTTTTRFDAILDVYFTVILMFV